MLVLSTPTMGAEASPSVDPSRRRVVDQPLGGTIVEDEDGGDLADRPTKKRSVGSEGRVKDSTSWESESAEEAPEHEATLMMAFRRS